MPTHYAPRTEAVRISESAIAGTPLTGPTALLTFARFMPPESPTFQRHASFRTPEDAAEALYRLLHQWDDEGFSRIVVVLPPDTPEWRAIRDRLIRATVPL